MWEVDLCIKIYIYLTIKRKRERTRIVIDKCTRMIDLDKNWEFEPCNWFRYYDCPSADYGQLRATNVDFLGWKSPKSHHARHHPFQGYNFIRFNFNGWQFESDNWHIVGPLNKAYWLCSFTLCLDKKRPLIFWAWFGPVEHGHTYWVCSLKLC